MDILADKDYKVGISVKTDAKGAEKDIKSLDENQHEIIRIVGQAMAR